MNNQESSRNELPTEIPSRLEPAVKYGLNTLQLTLALLRGDSDMIDLVSVQIVDALDTRELLEFLDRPNANNLDHGVMSDRSRVHMSWSTNLLQVFTRPERDGCAPVTIPGDVPVTGV